MHEPLALASEAAILVAPLALGALADLTGVVVGWSFVLALVLVSLVVVRYLPISPAGTAAEGPLRSA